jgi:hypothetical protein
MRRDPKHPEPAARVAGLSSCPDCQCLVFATVPWPGHGRQYVWDLTASSRLTVGAVAALVGCAVRQGFGAEGHRPHQCPPIEGAKRRSPKSWEAWERRRAEAIFGPEGAGVADGG